MECADCGCKVERGGGRIEVCGRSNCCCADLPVRRPAPDRDEGMSFDDRGIMRGGGPPIAWFKDPAGNILAVIQD